MAEPFAPTPAPAQWLSTSPPDEGGYILLVEDNPGDARLTQALLADDGDAAPLPPLRWVQSAAAAVQVLEAEPGCRAVLLDLGLPDAQGLGSLQAILPCAGHCPVLVLTGDASDAVGLASVEAGAQDFMVKGSFDAVVLRRSLNFAGQRKRVEQDRLLRALHDDVTGLPRRALLLDRLQGAIKHCRRNNGRGALLFIDLDHFKRINDTLGHQAGDDVLRHVALRLSEGLRASDTVARVGGDEFTVLLPTDVSSADALAVGRKLLALVERPMRCLGQTVCVSASVGVAMFDGLEVNTELLMQRADHAMYAAKASGRGRVVLL